MGIWKYRLGNLFKKKKKKVILEQIIPAGRVGRCCGVWRHESRPPARPSELVRSLVLYVAIVVVVESHFWLVMMKIGHHHRWLNGMKRTRTSCRRYPYDNGFAPSNDDVWHRIHEKRRTNNVVQPVSGNCVRERGFRVNVHSTKGHTEFRIFVLFVFAHLILIAPHTHTILSHFALLATIQWEKHDYTHWENVGRDDCNTPVSVSTLRSEQLAGGNEKLRAGG